jgi:hypothetical protein
MGNERIRPAESYLRRIGLFLQRGIAEAASPMWDFDNFSWAVPTLLVAGVSGRKSVIGRFFTIIL